MEEKMRDRLDKKKGKGGKDKGDGRLEKEERVCKYERRGPSRKGRKG